MSVQTVSFAKCKTKHEMICGNLVFALRTIRTMVVTFGYQNLFVAVRKEMGVCMSLQNF